MMMQRELGPTSAMQRPLGQRALASMRGCATLLLSVAMLPVGAAAAEGHPVHVRARTVARQTELAPTDHAKGTGHSGKTSGTKSAGKAARKAGTVKAGRSAEKIESRGGSAHARAGRHKHPVEDESEPVTLHRTGWHATKPTSRGRVVAAERVPARRVKAAVSTRDDALDATIADAPKPLTVEDFMRAASPADVTPSGKVYVPGESRTEEDDRVDGQQPPIAAVKLPPVPKPILALKPAPVRRAAVVASVEASPSPGVGSGSLERDTVEGDAPSDLVGAPMPSNDGDAARTPAGSSALRATALPSRLPSPTRQEFLEEVEQPVVLPGLYRNGRLVVPAPLKGTHEILVHQNLMADDEGLERIQDEYDLNRLRAAHLLINLPESASLHVNPELAGNRRCARVWTVKFADDMARDFYARFHQPLQVNSAVRTVAYQVRLQRTNGNAAGIGGETASPHLTGQALDFGKRDMSMAQIAWMRSYLLPLMQAGKVDVEEEFQQACFHISVYRTYMALPAKRRVVRNEVAQLREPRVKNVTRGEDVR